MQFTPTTILAIVILLVAIFAARVGQRGSSWHLHYLIIILLALIHLALLYEFPVAKLGHFSSAIWATIIMACLVGVALNEVTIVNLFLVGLSIAQILLLAGLLNLPLPNIDVPLPESNFPTHVPSLDEPLRGNIAPRAYRVPDGIDSNNAFDGNLNTFWTDGLGHRFTLQLSWSHRALVNRIIVWDRPQNSPDNNQINQLVVTLSNGFSERFDMNSQGGRCVELQFSELQSIDAVTLMADDASGNNGLSEIEVWVGEKTSGATCSNTRMLP